MSEQTMMFDMADPNEVKVIEKRRKAKPLARSSDPVSSFEAAGQFRESGGIQSHEDKIRNALYQLGNATGHELVNKIEEIYPESPLTHVQVMRRTGAMSDVAHGEVRDCVCGKRCREMRPK